ncbi:MAG TPA: glycosyltransferase family 4 protein [Gaiellaceae bacterium]|nr:glycosyltransferase family 4 protein [Gaiellaceae bacterium]
MSRTRYRLPPEPRVAAKFDALREELDVRVLASAAPGSLTNDETFALVPPVRPRALDGLSFWVALPWRTARMLREFRPRAVLCQTAYDGAAALLARRIARVPARVVVEVHGDWRTSTRLYGSSSRRLLGRVGDTVAATAIRHADAVRTVSPFTAGLVRELGVEPAADFPAYMELDPFVVPPAPPPERPVALFVGVLEAYKNVDGLAAAWRQVVQQIPQARLVLVGKGARQSVIDELMAELPDQVDHVRELSPEGVAERLDEATVLVLPSRSEGLGRVVIEAFARGRGVVASRVGGIPDLVRDDVEGRLVDPLDGDQLVEVLIEVLSDRALAERYGEAAAERYRDWHTTPTEFAAQVRGLVEASLRDAGEIPGERPRVLIVADAAQGAPFEGSTDATLAALREELDYCVLGRAERGVAPRRTVLAPGSVLLVRRWPGPLDSLMFYGSLPFRIASLVRRFKPSVVIAESPYIGFFVLMALAFRRRRPSLVIETHGDWRAATRLEGSRMRILLAPFADRAARYALRRADALRALSPYTAELAEREAGVPPLESFPAYIDLSIFTSTEPALLPARPSALFVGMLEPNKNIDALARAWRTVAAEVPDARLVIVGSGALLDVVDRLRDDFPESVVHHRELAPVDVAREMDESTCLVLPSRSEGLGRVLIESFARGRGVVASRVGGIPDVVRDGVEGLLVDPSDDDDIARALVDVLSDPELAARLGDAARLRYRDWDSTPDDYAARVRLLVDRAVAATER